MSKINLERRMHFPRLTHKNMLIRMYPRSSCHNIYNKPRNISKILFHEMFECFVLIFLNKIKIFFIICNFLTKLYILKNVLKMYLFKSINCANKNLLTSL